MSKYQFPDLRKVALDLLARREHSALELKRKLFERGFDLHSIDTVLAELKEEGLQSDQRFTECYVRFRAERGFGPLHIKAELRERGVAEELIKNNLDESAEIWLRSVVKTREKKFGASMPDGFNERGKQIRFLKYKGFSNDQIKFALGNSDFETDE